jgi:hypothetical protein
VRQFLFVDGRAWVIMREQARVLLLETDEGKSVPLFSDDDLAKTYIEARGECGWRVKVLDGAEQVLKFLTALQEHGVVYVALDPKWGQEQSVMTKIEVVIEEVRRGLADED